MKTGVILLSLLAAALTWWSIRRSAGENLGKNASRFHGFIKSLAIGICVYAILTLSALVYLAFH